MSVQTQASFRTHSGPSTHLLDLNHDIFQHIVAFLDRHTLSLLSRTCRTLRRELVTQLLRGTVSTWRPLLGNFKEFLDVEDDRPRHDFLRRWEFITFTHASSFSHSQVYRDLCSILRASHNLVSLSIDKVIPDVVPPKDLKLALAAIPQLHELSLLTIGPKYEDVLHGVLPNLRVLRLDFSTDRLSPLNFLATHRNTIRELTLKSIWPQNAFPSDPPPDPFPSVRHLCVDPIDSPRGLVILARCFPNLDTLALRTVLVDDQWRLDNGLFAATMEHQQQGSFTQLARWYDRTMASVQDHGGTWPRLATLRIHDSVGLFLAPLCCPADRLEVVQASIMPEQMAYACAELRPRVVIVPPESSPTAFLEAARCHLVPLEHTPSVSHLTVRISAEVVAGLPLDQVLAALSEALRRSSVAHLLLEFSSLGDFAPSEEMRTFYGDADGARDFLSRSIPSLRKVFFDIEGRDLKAWELDSAGSGGWQAMHEWEALRFISAEGMRDSGRAY